jgi:Family of unknown function (DUF6328)
MDPERDETSAQRWTATGPSCCRSRRVTQIGGQILSGFLLTLPFQARFSALSHGQQGLYLTVVLLGLIRTAHRPGQRAPLAVPAPREGRPGQHR